MKALRSPSVISLLTTSLSYQTMAVNNVTNNQAKIDSAERVCLSKADPSSKYNHTTTPELQKIIRQFNNLDTSIRKQPDMEMGCDMPIHYYLDLGQDHLDNPHKILQVKVISPHAVRATFKQFDDHRVDADFTLKCTENRCLIDDLKMIGGQTSIKADYKLVLRKQKCE